MQPLLKNHHGLILAFGRQTIHATSGVQCISGEIRNAKITVLPEHEVVWQDGNLATGTGKLVESFAFLVDHANMPGHVRNEQAAVFMKRQSVEIPTFQFIESIDLLIGGDFQYLRCLDATIRRGVAMTYVKRAFFVENRAFHPVGGIV